MAFYASNRKAKGNNFIQKRKARSQKILLILPLIRLVISVQYQYYQVNEYQAD